MPEQPCGGDYGYDWVGNRLNPPTGTNHMVYNAADQLTSWPGMYSYYGYYSDGSLKEVKNAKGALISSYTYHPNGLLDEATYVTSQGNHTAVNTWDVSGNRVGLTMNGEVYSFVYDITAGIPSVVEESDGTNAVYYYREPSGALIARTDADNGMRYYHFDALGSTRLLTDVDGDITDKYAYDAWGAVVAHDRVVIQNNEEKSSVDQPYQYVGQYGYYTHYQDPDFKLLQLGVRFYDAETGRFTQQDKLRDGINVYVYCGNDPLYYVDYDGRNREHPDHPGPGVKLRCSAGMSLEEINNRIELLEELISKHGPGTPHTVEEDLRNLQRALDICKERKRKKEEYERKWGRTPECVPDRVPEPERINSPQIDWETVTKVGVVVVIAAGLIFAPEITAPALVFAF